MKDFWLPALVILLGGVLLASPFIFQKEISYPELMEADVDGGRTPAETLELFIKAINKGEVERAAKYFSLDENGQRGRWLKALEEAKAAGRLAALVSEIEQAQPNPRDSVHPGDFKYVIFDEAGSIKTTINLELNSYSGVWKIESL